MTDTKEEEVVEPTKEKEMEKAAEDEKKSETKDKEKTEDKVEAKETEKANDEKMETDDKEKEDDDDDKEEKEPTKEEDTATSKAKATKKRKKDEPPAKTTGTPEEEDDMEESETADAATDGRPKREKRVRKSADVFEPDNFLGKDKSLQVVAGRGTKLSDIAAVKATIDKLSVNSSDLMLAHRLLYTRQGKPPKKVIKKNILEFCGFLPTAVEGQDKKELEALEEEAEVRMSRSLGWDSHVDHFGFEFM